MKPLTTPNPEFPVLGPILETLRNFKALTGSSPESVRITAAQYEQLQKDVGKLPQRLRTPRMPDIIMGVPIVIDNRGQDGTESGEGGRQPGGDSKGAAKGRVQRGNNLKPWRRVSRSGRRV